MRRTQAQADAQLRAFAREPLHVPALEKALKQRLVKQPDAARLRLAWQRLGAQVRAQERAMALERHHVSRPAQRLLPERD
jgi:hypothetical protein